MADWTLVLSAVVVISATLYFLHRARELERVGQELLQQQIKLHNELNRANDDIVNLILGDPVMGHDPDLVRFAHRLQAIQSDYEDITSLNN